MTVASVSLSKMTINIETVRQNMTIEAAKSLPQCLLGQLLLVLHPGHTTMFQKW